MGSRLEQGCKEKRNFVAEASFLRSFEVSFLRVNILHHLLARNKFAASHGRGSVAEPPIEHSCPRSDNSNSGLM